ncbi:phosphatidylinositol glycan anchor biosynthesis class G isoform X1 [Lasioglossum baleicum]|uniref:phosphatidylinositol glycan anchor biosynthesis class G isoform X1 n=2 Tax=Lasioglossum baleicum TaxID=434251 RepID=UPI003FCEA7AC
MKDKEIDKSIITLLYILIIGFLSIALFLYGFFPLVNYDNTIATEKDIPKFVENVRVKVDELYQPMVKRLVIMVIDALRWDFITGSIGKVAMPITSSLIANSSACLFQVKVHSPTVTMPRIKAFTTGTVPSFSELASNFGSKPVAGDSILLQAKNYGYESIFYGDETWLTLFPSMFKRYEGTTSFVVTDFTEVDSNVTRHLRKELHSKTDWSIMILHYLGLDHIGHVHGPSSPLIKTKLKEMDTVIAKIQAKVRELNQNNDSSLFIICGDHGMKDSGGHGGSTISETTVPFITIGNKCMQHHKHFTEIEQVDIASTLSSVLGVPIPHLNLGSVFLDSLYDLPVAKKLYVLHYNAKQVFDHFQQLTDYKSEYAYQKYKEALKLHTAWLNTKDHPNDMTDDIILSYKYALKGMKELLINSMIKYDFHVIVVAMFFLSHMICILLKKNVYTLGTLRNTNLLVVLNISLWIIINYFWNFDGISILHLKNLTSIVIVLFVIIVLIVNCCLLAGGNYTNFFMLKNTENILGKWLLSLGTFVHAISLSGSSFVEEEHQTWYFHWVTLLTLLLYNFAGKFYAHLQFYSNYKRYMYAQTCIKLLLLLIGHRILRKLNSTGDKYANLPDIAGFLVEQESMLGMTFVLMTAIVLLIWLDFMHEDEKYKIQSLIIHSIMGVCIYLRHMNNNSVIKLPLYPQSRGIYEVQILWILLSINVFNYIYRIGLTIQCKQAIFLRIALFSIVRIWVMVTAIIHQPYNVILLPLQIIFSGVIRAIIQDNSTQQINTLVYTWIGNVFYFYQGNSNSLATVDVAAGYVGIQSYKPIINASLLIINTYTAPGLACLLLIYQAVLQYSYNTRETVMKISKTYVTWRLVPLTAYTIIISIQRHHLFVWSVFSPKLIYETTYFVVIFIITLVILILSTLQKAMKNDVP